MGIRFDSPNIAKFILVRDFVDVWSDCPDIVKLILMRV